MRTEEVLHQEITKEPDVVMLEQQPMSSINENPLKKVLHETLVLCREIIVSDSETSVSDSETSVSDITKQQTPQNLPLKTEKQPTTELTNTFDNETSTLSTVESKLIVRDLGLNREQLQNGNNGVSIPRAVESSTDYFSFAQKESKNSDEERDLCGYDKFMKPHFL